MNDKDKKMIMVGILLVMMVAILAPYLASSNPDGLESAAEKFESTEGKDMAIYKSPMPDYIMPSFGESAESGVIAIVIGTLITFLLVYGISEIFVRRKSDNRA